MAGEYKQFINRYFHEFLTNGDAKATAALYAENATIWDNANLKLERGRDAVERAHTEILTAFPNLSGEIANVVGGLTDAFAVELTCRGSHTGPLKTPEGEIPATGKRFEINVLMYGRVNEQGLCVEDRTYFNLADLQKQLSA
jgi:hypothetical protein